jgi:hypothetical protein
MELGGTREGILQTVTNPAELLRLTNASRGKGIKMCERWGREKPNGRRN